MRADRIAELADISERLGLDQAAELTALRDFRAGPPVVLVTGSPRPDRGRLESTLTDAIAPASTAEVEIAGVRDRLWDVLVLASPADTLLPNDQQDLLRTAAPAGCAIMVAVTGLHRLGDESVQATSRAELEQLRLRPLLTPLGLRWWFTGPDDTSDGLRSEVARQCAHDDVHVRRIRATLLSLTDDAIARCEPRVEERERQRELLHRLRRQAGPAEAEARDQVEIQVLAAKDVLSELFERFSEQVEPARDRALTWLANGRITPWDDVVHPIQRAWTDLITEVQQVAARQAAALHAELDRIVRAVVRAAEQLAVTVEPPSFADRTWADPASAEALTRLADVDLAPVLQRFHEHVTPRKPVEENGSVVQRVGSGIEDRFRKPDPEHVAAQLDTGLRTTIRPRATAVVETIQVLVQTEGNADATAVAAWLEATAKVVGDEVEERQRWYDVYLELLAFRDRL